MQYYIESGVTEESLQRQYDGLLTKLEDDRAAFQSWCVGRVGGLSGLQKKYAVECGTAHARRQLHNLEFLLGK